MKKLTHLILLIFVIISILSCMGDPVYETALGKEIIPSDTLEYMIYDIHLADAIITSKILKTEDNKLVDSLMYEEIYNEYSYSKEDFKQTLLFYTHNKRDSLNTIYERVMQRLSIEKGKIY